ncbi:hypothetical protein [Ascidiaceihabitans sp.]|uniref:phage tail terminator protein n=1 Tax=Ascidiaceihabitans sp. TaxID=1872644 RepID=UPI00329A6A3E
MFVDDVITRLKQDVSDLQKVEGASAFSAVVQSGQAPTRTPVAYVISSEMRGGQAEASAGAFIQDVSENISVALMLRSSDRIGTKGIEPIDTLKRSVINALCGWMAPGRTDVFDLRSGKMLSFNAGLLTYALEFSTTDQLRIFS